MNNNAFAWAELRETWLALDDSFWGPLRDSVLNFVLGAMELVAPTSVPMGSLLDSGDIMFADGSSILWTWKGGNSLIVRDENFTSPSNPRQYSYPWRSQDPVFRAAALLAFTATDAMDQAKIYAMKVALDEKNWAEVVAISLR